LARLLVTLATLLALILGAAFVAPAFVDWNAYRQDIERAASAILGRTITIAGAIDIALLPEPHFRATKVAAEGGPGDGAQMTADAVDLSLSLQAVLAGRIEASRLKLVRPFLIVDFSKPLQKGLPPAQATSLPIGGAVSSLEIEGGRVSILQDASRPDALTLADVEGVLSAPAPGNAYRFNGRFSQGDRRYEARFIAAPAPRNGVKLTGAVVDLASRVTVHADGVLRAGNAPVFEGAVAMAAPPASGLAGSAFDVQAKANARIDLSGASLSDLVLTIEAENRPQVLLGVATLAFPAMTADVTLQARSLDADTLFAAGSSNRSQDGAARLLWMVPDYGLRLSLAAEQLQLRGELIEGVKLRGTRRGQTWAFEEAAATLPGDSRAKASGSFISVGGKSSLAAELDLQGKNLGRLNRWIAPQSAGARVGQAKSFAIKGALALSDEIAAFTNVSGDVEGAPFTASLRLGRAAVRKLEVSLAGESFDLRGLEAGGGAALSAESLKAVWQAGLQQAAPVIGDAQSFDTADIDVSATAIKTGAVEARNVAVRLKFNRDLLTVAKLSFETPEGLELNASGVVPLRGAGQGRLDGRIEARSSQAMLKAAALLGVDAERLQGRRLEELAPASLIVDYGAEEAAGTATVRLNGVLGVARIQGRAQLKGALADWRSGQLSAQLDLSEPDGDRLVTLMFPGSFPAPGSSAAPGQLTIRAEGASSRYAVTGALKSGPLQAQIEGTSELKGQGLAFNGKARALSPAPEQFLPPSLLALLGAEPKADLRIEADLALGRGQFAATKLKAESSKNLVAGRLSVTTTEGARRIDADLAASQASLPALLGSLLAQPADRAALPIPASVSPPSSELWSGQPFALGVFQDAAANIALTAKTLKLGETLALSDARLAAKLENARLDVHRLEGKTLGGDLAATISLDARGGNAVSAAARVSLSGADLSALWAPGSPPMAAARAKVTLQAAGQGLSPRGVVSVLKGEGVVEFSEGKLSRIAPAAVQKAAEDLMAGQAALAEEAVKKKALEAAQSSDFKFAPVAMRVAIHDGMLEAPPVAFLGEDGAVGMEGYLDLSSLKADTTWQLGPGSDRGAKWPPVKLQIAGPLRALGAAPRSLLAEDFVRAVLIRKMEGDIARLEGMSSRAQILPAPQPWATTQQKEQPKPARRKRAEENASPPQQ
jgi:uncharacterized protein involved in outer membrane biogenesis